MANGWIILMQRLGSERRVAQGGDWGSRVTHALAAMRPPGLIAAHMNWPYVFPASKPAPLTSAEARAYADLQNFFDHETGYSREQQTRPQTIGYALADSPAGQAAWIYEKFQAWTDNRGSSEDAISLDALLDDISLYWLTNSSASSARFYLENTKPGAPSYSAGCIELPMAASIFPKEIYRPPRAWAEALWPNLIYWNERTAAVISLPSSNRNSSSKSCGWRSATSGPHRDDRPTTKLFGQRQDRKDVQVVSLRVIAPP